MVTKTTRMLCATLLVLVALLVYYCFVKPLGYWQEKGIPFIKGAIPFFGNHARVFLGRSSLFDFTLDIYNTLPNERYCGFYMGGRPLLLVRDIDLIRQIGVKDFDHFTDHYGLLKRGLDPLLDKNLFVLQGQEWREMRATLSPAFTGSKMRAMLPFMIDCADNFVRYYEEMSKDLGMVVLEMKEAITRYTNDVIASSAFGLQCDSFKEKNNEFYTHGREMISQNWKKTTIATLILITPLSILQALKVKILPSSVKDFFKTIIRNNIKERDEKGIIRADLIHLLLEARKGKLKHENVESKQEEGFATVEESQIGKEENLQIREISDDEITAQAFLFFFAGFETTSTLCCFMAHELATNPEIQERLHLEIEDALRTSRGQITYEDIMKMKYLDQVISESLRLWTPGFQSDRVCVKDYVIQPTSPHEKPCTIKKGQTVIFPIIGLHRNPEYFPNPEKFDPERFNDENKQKILPGTYLPFGVGPRNCIGSRFALLEIKTLFIKMLSKFELVATEKTVVPMMLKKSGFSLTAQGGFWLGLKARNSNF